MSLATGEIRTCFKLAKVTPLLKKKSLDKDVYKNYRPVSLLCFLSKLLERCVMIQLQEYLTKNNLHSSTQSAYRPGYSTESALLKVHNDVLRAVDDHRQAVQGFEIHGSTGALLPEKDNRQQKKKRTKKKTEHLKENPQKKKGSAKC